MNEELQSKFVEVLTGISEGVAQAKDFAVEQLPDVAQQYIMFGMVWETVAFVVLMLCAVACAYTLWWCLKHLDGGKTEVLVLGIMFSGFGVMGLGLWAFLELKDVILVWFAPKLYLLQGIAGLVK
jgi:hypothetical protein